MAVLAEERTQRTPWAYAHDLGARRAALRRLSQYYCLSRALLHFGTLGH